MNLVFFKGITFIILIVFAIYISDFKTKKGMIPIINKKFIWVIKSFYFIPIFIYMYVILNLENLLVSNYIGGMITFLGAFIVAKAKIDIGIYHTWTGHKLRSTKMITKGIYSFIRHPLYTGIYLFVLGAVVTSIYNNPFSLVSTIVILMLVIFMMIFLAITALRESKFLHEEFGNQFLEYQKQVHPFLPLRKYSFEE